MVPARVWGTTSIDRPAAAARRAVESWPANAVRALTSLPGTPSKSRLTPRRPRLRTWPTTAATSAERALALLSSRSVPLGPALSFLSTGHTGRPAAAAAVRVTGSGVPWRPPSDSTCQPVGLRMAAAAAWACVDAWEGAVPSVQRVSWRPAGAGVATGTVARRSCPVRRPVSESCSGPSSTDPRAAASPAGMAREGGRVAHARLRWVPSTQWSRAWGRAEAMAVRSGARSKTTWQTTWPAAPSQAAALTPVRSTTWKPITSCGRPVTSMTSWCWLS